MFIYAIFIIEKEMKGKHGEDFHTMGVSLFIVIFCIVF